VGDDALDAISQSEFELMKFALTALVILILCLLMALGALPGPPVLPTVLAAASAAFLLTGARPGADMLHPVRVFGSLWCFCLALASMRMLSFISRWDTGMWALVLTGLVSFVGGFALFGLVRGRQGKSPPSAREFVQKRRLLPARKALGMAAVCLLVGTFVLAYEDALIGSVPILASNPDVARMKLFPVVGQSSLDTLSIKLIHPFVEFVKYGVFLAAIVLFQAERRNKKLTFACLGLMIGGTLIYMSQGARSFAVQVAIVLLVLFHYLRRRVRLKHVIAAVLLVFLFAGLFGAYRIRKSHSAPLFERALSVSGFPRGEFWEAVAFGYATATTSFEVFHELTHDFQIYRKPPHGFLLYSFHRLIPRSNIQQFAAGLYTPQAITPTFLGEFYGDFGYLGVLFGPLVLGWAYGWAYSRMKTAEGLYPIYVQALFLQILIYFPYTDLFSNYLTWIFDMFFMYFLIRGLERRAVAGSEGAAGRVPPAMDPQRGGRLSPAGLPGEGGGVTA
jgi:oligosaccharide repeat unit polymerase